MARSGIRYANYELPDGRKVRARYKSATKNGNPYWRADPQDNDFVFVINQIGKIKQESKRNPYAIYPHYHGKTVAEVKRALRKDAEGKVQDPEMAAENDLEWDGGTLTGMESGKPMDDGRKWVTHPLTNEQARTYLVIGRIIKP